MVTQDHLEPQVQPVQRVLQVQLVYKVLKAFRVQWECKVHKERPVLPAHKAHKVQLDL
jgi:hypothetical protein